MGEEGQEGEGEVEVGAVELVRSFHLCLQETGEPVEEVEVEELAGRWLSVMKMAGEEGEAGGGGDGGEGEEAGGLLCLEEVVEVGLPEFLVW